MISLIKTSTHFILVSFMLAASLAAGNAMAADMSQSVSVMLDGAHEVPPNTSTATGSGSFTVGSDKSVSGSVTTKGINGTVAHIHEAGPGQNGPVIVKLVKGDGGVWSVPPGSSFTDSQYASFKAGNLYVNVHSAAIPGGEIRGQLIPK